MNWNDYFMEIAKTVAIKSRDPSTQVGCLIVDDLRRPVSFGFNGFVAGADESQMSYDRPLKYHLIIHSEENAVIHARRDLHKCVAYITHGPCDGCLKMLLQSGIREVYYADAGPMIARSTELQRDAIKRLILATSCKCENLTNGKSYYAEIAGVDL